MSNKCAIPGCETTKLSSKYRFCTAHWAQYKDDWKAGTPWLRELVLMHRSEEYAELRSARRETSLEGLVERGVLSMETTDIWRGPPTKHHKPRKRHRRRRGEAPIEGEFITR